MLQQFRRVSCVVLLLALLGGCCSGSATVRGFPAYDTGGGATGVQKAVPLVLRDIHAVEMQIEAVQASPAARGTETASPQVRHLDAESLRMAYETLFGAYLSMGNEHLVFRDPPQSTLPPHPPVLVYPRLTSPAIVEPVRRTDASGVTTWTYFVPVIVDKDSLYWDQSPETVWLGRSRSRIHYDRPREHFRSWLIRFGEPDAARRGPLELRPHVLELPTLRTTLPSGDELTLPDVHSNLAGGVVLLPLAEDGVDGVRPGFYDMQVLPAIPLPALASDWGRAFGADLENGDWYRAFDRLGRPPVTRDAEAARALEGDLLAIAKGIDGYVPTRFDDVLAPIRSTLLHWAWRLPDPARRCEGPPAGLRRAVERLLDPRREPHPVLLDRPAEGNEPFTFVMCGDFQFHDDLRPIRRLFRMIGAYATTSLDEDPQAAGALPPDVRARLEDVKFVLIAGDLGDGEGTSSSPGTAVVAALGLLPPRSPYTREFPALRREFARLGVPVVAVPGNHDGFVNYGGLLNNAVALAGRILEVPPEPIRFITYPAGHALEEASRHLPTLVKVGRLAPKPYYDGLVAWQYELGPLNAAFAYRGCSFIGFNSYDLPSLYRDQIGPLAMNWGGGVSASDALWFDAITRWLREREGTQAQFVFMHHDPRAGIPDPAKTGVEKGYGRYDGADAPWSTLTFGYGGLTYSPLNPLSIPLVTTVGNYGWRLLSTGDRFNQEWMGPAWVSDTDCHHAESIVHAITDNLAGPEPGDGGITHIFFGHDDDFARGQWVHPEACGAVFAPPPGRQWTGNTYGRSAPLVPFAKVLSAEPPEWGRKLKVTDGRNADVIRMDDVGDNGSDEHGFQIVTVTPQGEGRSPRVVVTRVQIPSEAPSTLPPGRSHRPGCGGWATAGSSPRAAPSRLKPLGPIYTPPPPPVVRSTPLAKPGRVRRR